MHDSPKDSAAGCETIEAPTEERPRLRKVGILGTGSYAPEKILNNEELSKIVDTSDSWIVERTGMQERRIAGKDEATSHLAIAAARSALDQAGVKAADIELIVVATATPDTLFPATACRVQQAIGATRAAGFDVSAACAGFVNALMTADSMIAAGYFQNALVIGAEKLSSIIDYTDRNTCILFGDGAGAVVLGADTDGATLIDHTIRIDGEGLDLIELPAGGSRQPATADSIATNQHFLKLEGKKVFRFAVNVICESVTEVLERNGYTIGDLDLLIPHQANLRIIEAANAKLGIDPDRVAVNIEKYGNTSAASIPILLDELSRDGQLKKGQLICFVAFGAGLSWGASLLRW